jgi:hypothetical protein
MFWSVVIDGEEYRSEVVLIGDDLEAVSVPDGGSVSGRVAFMVLQAAESAGFEIKYAPFLGGRPVDHQRDLVDRPRREPRGVKPFRQEPCARSPGEHRRPPAGNHPS